MHPAMCFTSILPCGGHGGHMLIRWHITTFVVFMPHPHICKVLCTFKAGCPRHKMIVLTLDKRRHMLGHVCLVQASREHCVFSWQETRSACLEQVGQNTLIVVAEKYVTPGTSQVMWVAAMRVHVRCATPQPGFPSRLALQLLQRFQTTKQLPDKRPHDHASAP